MFREILDTSWGLRLIDFNWILIFFILACLTIRQDLGIDMITIVIAKNEEKVKELVNQLLCRLGNANIGIIKQGDTIKIAEGDDFKGMVQLKDKIIELEDSLYNDNKGTLYKSVLETIERPLIEHMLEHTEGNQLKAAKILGLNRNTIRAKIKKLGINIEKWKT